MTTRYVRKDGNDGSGNGTDAAPYLTLTKALSTLNLGGGHLVLMGDGVFAENSSSLGYFLAQVQFTNQVIVRPEGGAAGDVTLTGTNHDTWNVRFDDAQKIRFEYIKIRSDIDTQSMITFTNTTINNIEFYKCPITVRSRAAQTTFGLFDEPAGVQNHSNILLDECTILQTGNNLVEAARFNKTADGATLDAITLRNCIVNVTLFGLWLTGVTNFLIDGGSFLSTGANGMGIQLGQNAQTGRNTTGVVRKARAQCLQGHALLIGAGCSAVQALNNLVLGGDQGLVVKDCDGAILTGNNVQGGSINALYFKAATNAIAAHNTIFNNQGVVMKVGCDSTNSAKCQNIDFRYNRLFGVGSAMLLDWGDDVDDLGGGICDYNIYSPHGSGKLGVVRADPHVASLAELRAAWAGYGAGSNDSHSRLLQDELPQQAYSIRH